MRIGFSKQYGTPVVVLECGDTDPEEVIERAEENGAVVQDGDYLLVVRFPGCEDDLYTEEAVKRLLKTPSTSSS